MICINDARRLWGDFATFSRHWKERVNIFLSPALLFDADFYGVHEREIFLSSLWLTKNAITLGKLRLRTANYSTEFVAKILRSCDMFHLEHVEVIVGSTERCQLLDGMHMRKFLAEEVPQDEPMSIFDLYQEIAQKCPFVRKLKINCIAPTIQKLHHMSEAK
jgi:hypothetical protein